VAKFGDGVTDLVMIGQTTSEIRRQKKTEKQINDRCKT